MLDPDVRKGSGHMQTGGKDMYFVQTSFIDDLLRQWNVSNEDIDSSIVTICRVLLVLCAVLLLGETTCAVCEQPETYESIVDHFCRSDVGKP